MFLLKSLKKNQRKNETKKNRMKIKDLCIPSNKVFQVPFKKEQIDRYKGINDFYTNDCFFQVMTVLGLRHYTVSKKDSLKIKKSKSYGVETRDAAKYLSTIFNATIVPKDVTTQKINDFYSNYNDIYVPRTSEPIHKQLISMLDLENGYATFICGQTCPIDSTSVSGHYFIIYKENNTIYYYDQSSDFITKDVYKILGTKHNPFIGFFIYYNESKEKCILLKDKIKIEVPI
jgi:hypothetical protein